MNGSSHARPPSGSPQESTALQLHIHTRPDIVCPLSGGILPVYDLAAVAHALDIDLKQLDNLLSRNALPGIEKRRRGIARRLTPDIAVVIRLARDLSESLGVSVGTLLAIAYSIERGATNEVRLGEHVTLCVDRDALRMSTSARLDAAVEVIGTRRRGRPPTRERSSAGKSAGAGA